MKPLFRRWIFPSTLVALLLIPMVSMAAVQDQPAIQEVRIEQNEIVVRVEIPPGFKKITLESRTRIGTGAWEPRAVSRLDGAGGTILFRLPIEARLELLRVRADVSEPLPARFYDGESSFAGAPGPNPDTPPPSSPGGPEQPDPGDDDREVVESDIWRLEGDILYFFNQFRGLQIIDVSDPDLPLITGTLPYPAAGEQMYLLGNNRVLLLARDGCEWGPRGPESQVLVINVEGEPFLENQLPVPGTIQESRLVGTALYIASNTYQPTGARPGSDDGEAPEQWEYGTMVSSFDFSNPASPLERESAWFPGFGHAIYATERFLFLAARDPATHFQSVIHLLDISAPDGALLARSSIPAAGFVKDKFKMNLSGDTFSVISQTWDDQRRWSTSLETFNIANPAAPNRLALLQLAEGEELHATRFDGAKVYIVTFFQVDPLWVIDLSDPANPEIAGELEVPGWSTYIHPMGDRLLAVGIDDVEGWRVAVSLFDVKDPANPSLLDKVPLGENHSWSEANQDEKAFKVLPEAGLILVPYQGETSQGFANRVQLIDFTDSSLTARGMIEHAFQPRRTAWHRDRILSLSGMELLSVDATDRDQPLVRAELDLGWAADRLFLAGDYLIQIEYGRFWGAPLSPKIRISTSADPETILERLELDRPWPITGAAVRDQELYLVQSFPEHSQLEETDPSGNLVLTVLNLSKLPQIELAAETSVTTRSLGWNPNLEPLWPKPNLLVWTGGSSGGWWGGPEPGPVDPAPGPGIAASALAPWPWFGGSTGGRFLAFELRENQAPEFVSELDFGTDQGWQYWTFSKAFSAGELVYISRPVSEFMETDPPPNGEGPPPDPNLPPPDDKSPPGDIPPPDDTAPPPDGGSGATPPGEDPGSYETGESVLASEKDPADPAPYGVWIQRHYLTVIDFADPRAPTVRRPVNIPGTLQQVTHGGALIHTTGFSFDEQGQTDWKEQLQVSAYDGVSASLVSSMPLPQTWPRPQLWNGAQFFLGVPGEQEASPELQTWTFSEAAGTFAQTGSLKLPQPAQTLHRFGDLLAAQTQGELRLINASNPNSLQLLGSADLTGCIYYDLNRAIGSLATGLWIGLGEYGVGRIKINE